MTKVTEAQLAKIADRNVRVRTGNRARLHEWLTPLPCGHCGKTGAEKAVLGRYAAADGEPREFSSLVSRGNSWRTIEAAAEQVLRNGDVVCQGCGASRHYANQRPTTAPGTQLCTGPCGEVKPLVEFNIKDKATGRRRRDCKLCYGKAVAASIAKRQARLSGDPATVDLVNNDDNAKSAS